MSRTGTVEAISAELKEVKDEIKQRKQYLDHAQRASETAEFMALPEAERLVRLQTLKFDREVTQCGPRGMLKYARSMPTCEASEGMTLAGGIRDAVAPGTPKWEPTHMWGGALPHRGAAHWERHA